MEKILQLAGLLLTTTLAGASAAAFNWLLLRGMFRLIEPAARSHRRPLPSGISRSDLVNGTRQLARQFASEHPPMR